MKKSTIQHLRLPFSFFLMPVFLFALAVAPVENTLMEALSVFIVLHILVYPASNGYNSFFDKDEGSIGGLKAPPKVTKELYAVSLLLDVIAISWSAFISLPFAFMVLIYGLISKAYSHPSIRLKRYPIIGWLTIGVFQGFFTVWMSLVGLGTSWLEFFDQPLLIYASVLASFLLLGSYPMTQVYQHEEDAERGDRTISLKLGILGTFHFTAILFFFSSIGYMWFFRRYYALTHVFLFLAFLTPVLLFFGYWYLQVRKDRTAADFERTMKLNVISSTCLNLFFAYLAFVS
ncbi:MAG: UbiA family prenyltransferase [Cyclobacteriaceae bacterium]